MTSKDISNKYFELFDNQESTSFETIPINDPKYLTDIITASAYLIYLIESFSDDTSDVILLDKSIPIDEHSRISTVARYILSLLISETNNDYTHKSLNIPKLRASVIEVIKKYFISYISDDMNLNTFSGLFYDALIEVLTAYD